MEETLLPETVTDEVTEQTCIGCKSPDILQGYPNRLCAECRESYIKYPIPSWIKAFGAAIALLVVFSSINVYKNLIVGIHYERGVKAENGKRYLTAQKEFEKSLTKLPDNADARAHLLIAAFHNQDFLTLAKCSELLEGKTFEDQELFQKAELIFSLAPKYFPDDSLRTFSEKYGQVKDGIPEAALQEYYAKHPDDFTAALQYAALLMNEKQFDKADTICEGLLKNDAEYTPALMLLSASKRYQHDAQGALTFIDRLLEINKEDIYALSSKARVMVMLKKDKEALELALQAKHLAEIDPFNIATLAIVYHYNHNVTERDKLIAMAKSSKDSTMTTYFSYAMDIINNKEKLRD
jgi:tetratricopeptide (TPR) repeat protein